MKLPKHSTIYIVKALLKGEMSLESGC